MKCSLLILFLIVNVQLSSSDNLLDKLMVFKQSRFKAYFVNHRPFNNKPEKLTSYTNLLKENVDFLNNEIFNFIMNNETSEALKFIAPDFIYIERGTPQTVSRLFETIRKYSKYLTFPASKLIDVNYIIQESQHSSMKLEYYVNFGTKECKIVTENIESQLDFNITLTSVDLKCREVSICPNC
ncbi:unnamed protein product [Caenorhabditis angaria]|uniref:DUF38 domain-containing protein n=1 Tax=Caenorhabditis angaria TaxID=860376 RepID=A0A9P1IWQ3_9PELO|nr:unnamed protein product [Caenorhabditis angaria]